MPMAIRGPRPRSELKLRSAARLAVFVSEKVVAIVETTLRAAYSQPLGERSLRTEACQMS
jgi:hypothetical protein